MLIPSLYAGIDVGSTKNALCCLGADGKRLDKVKL
jgi:hypothetical protein